MNKTSGVSAYFAVLFLLLAGFQGTTPAAETMKQREQREALTKQLEIRFSEVNRKLTGLGGRSTNIKEESRREYARLVEDLQKKQELANRKMTELKSSSGQDWERLKAETNSAIDDLNGAYEKMSALFKTI